MGNQVSKVSGRLVIVVVGALVLACLGLALALRAATPEGAEFLFIGEPGTGRYADRKCAEVEGGRVCVGLVAESVWRRSSWRSPRHLLVEMRPYVRLEFEGLKYSDFLVDPEEVVVQDSEGHRLKVVGIWPDGTSGYRLDVDALNFNKYVKYQGNMRWTGHASRWEPDRRYTLSLHFPFKCRGHEYVVDIPRMVCCRPSRWFLAQRDIFGRKSSLRWDERPSPGEFYRGTRLDVDAPIPLLIEALRDEDPAVRLRAAEALARIGPKAGAAVPTLLEAVNDSSDAVRGTAAGAIQIIEGRDWREVEREWKEREGK